VKRPKRPRKEQVRAASPAIRARLDLVTVLWQRRELVMRVAAFLRLAAPTHPETERLVLALRAEGDRLLRELAKHGVGPHAERASAES
jgi:hypothetical protein